MRQRGERLPDLVLDGEHEAAPPLEEDWTLVRDQDTEKRLRDVRNKMIREQLSEGRTVFYKSSGDSMWPLIQSGDACLFHPIQVVTAEAGVHSIVKEASKIEVGDIVFFAVQPYNQYYAHIVMLVPPDPSCNS